MAPLPRLDDVLPICKKCGKQHITYSGLRSCNAHSTGRAHPEREGLPCRRFPAKGTTVCVMHGARRATVKQKAERVMAEKELAVRIEKLARTFGEPLEGADPGTIILERISALAGHVKWLQIRVEELAPDQVVWGKTMVKTGGKDAGTTHEARANVWIELYERFDKQLQKLCIEALKVGLQERQVRIAEREGAAICNLLDGLLRDFGIDPLAPESAEKVAKHLRLAN